MKPFKLKEESKHRDRQKDGSSEKEIGESERERERGIEISREMKQNNK